MCNCAVQKFDVSEVVIIGVLRLPPIAKAKQRRHLYEYGHCLLAEDNPKDFLLCSHSPQMHAAALL